MPSAAELDAARVIYDYHFPRLQPERGEVILALGTNDLRVAEHAAELYHRDFGQRLVCSGGIAHQGDLLATAWPSAEAHMYRDVALARGVPAEHIILETEATNTAENFVFTKRLLHPATKSIVVAVKPFMQRRARATLQVHWPEVKASFSSPTLTLDQYFTSELPPEKIIHILMGDLQRLWIYASKGWSAPQQIPPDVTEAFEYLKARGWTRHLLTEPV